MGRNKRWREINKRKRARQTVDASTQFPEGRLDFECQADFSEDENEIDRTSSAIKHPVPTTSAISCFKCLRLGEILL